MDFTLPEELRMLRETVARFVREELLPLEPIVLERESVRGYSDEPPLAPELEARLQAKAKALGLWGIDVPAEFGGQNLGALAKCVVMEQLKHSIVPFVLAPDSPNLYLLKWSCKGGQIDKYLLPYARGEKNRALPSQSPARDRMSQASRHAPNAGTANGCSMAARCSSAMPSAPTS